MITAAEILETHKSPGRFDHFRSNDRDQTEAFATTLFCPHEFKLARREKALSARIASASLSSLSLTSIGFGANVSVDPGSLGDFYLIQTVVDGSVDIVSNEQHCLATPGIATIISPNQPTKMLWDRDAHFLTLKIDKSALEAQLSALIGQPIEENVVFDLRFDLNRNDTKAWQSAVDSLFNVLRYTDWQQGDSSDAQLLERWIISSLLHTQPHNYSGRIHQGLSADWPNSIRSAVHFIDRHFKQALSAQQIAEAAGVSERKIRQDFSKYLGVSAKQYQLRLRLRYIRSALLDAKPNTSITNLLTEAGVQNFGRFSGYYQQEFGESPSSTLAKAKARRHSPEKKR